VLKKLPDPARNFSALFCNPSAALPHRISAVDRNDSGFQEIPMKAIFRTLTVSTLALTLSGGMAFAQDHHDDQRNQDHHPTRSDHDHGQSRNDARNDHGRDYHQHYVHHSDWRRGRRISHSDWVRGESVDWRVHRLRQPPRGYEWREIDGNYVLAAVATGVIASVIIAAASH
jgi:Ni/Co efflux regulator RcnB